MTQFIENLFILLRISSDIVLVVLGLLFVKPIFKQKDLCIIIFSCFLDITFYVVGELFAAADIDMNLYFGSFTVIEFLLFAYFISSNIESKRFRLFLTITSVGFVLFNIIYAYNAVLNNIDSVAIGIETILIFLYAFCYLFEQTSVHLETFIYHRFQFWVIIGILLYLAGSFFIYILASQVPRKALDDYWFLTNGLYVLKNILFAVGIFVYLKESKKSRSPQSIRPYLN